MKHKVSKRQGVGDKFASKWITCFIITFFSINKKGNKAKDKKK